MKRALVLRVSAGFCLVFVAMAGAGCVRTAEYRAKARGELEEHSRALTSGVVDVLQLQPESARDRFTDLALSLAREDQRVEGFPLEQVEVREILGIAAAKGSAKAGAKVQRAATEKLERRFARIRELRARDESAEQKLIALGATAEAERSERRARWWKWGGSTALLLGGLIALCVFFPVAIPILGRLAGFVVARIPALAGAAGVVSVKAFDAVIKAIERTKSSAPSNQNLGNDAARGSSPARDWVDELHLALSREMDAAHKSLVRRRKLALGLEK